MKQILWYSNIQCCILEPYDRPWRRLLQHPYLWRFFSLQYISKSFLDLDAYFSRQLKWLIGLWSRWKKEFSLCSGIIITSAYLHTRKNVWRWNIQLLKTLMLTVFSQNSLSYRNYETYLRVLRVISYFSENFNIL